MAARKITSTTYRAWDTPEKAILSALYVSGERTALLAALPGRSWGAVLDAARRLHLRRNKLNRWPAADLARLIAEYPEHGAIELAKAFNRPAEQVRIKANRMGIAYVRQGRKLRERKPRAVKAMKVAAEPRLPAVRRARPARPAPVRRAPGTPVLNAKKAQRKEQEIKRALAPITAEAIRAMRYDNPQRRAYMLDGVRGWQVYMQGVAA